MDQTVQEDAGEIREGSVAPAALSLSASDSEAVVSPKKRPFEQVVDSTGPTSHEEPVKEDSGDMDIDVKDKSQDQDQDGVVDVKTEAGAGSNGIIADKKDSAIVSSPLFAPQLIYASKTGLCYDVRMRYHAPIITSAYDYVDPHPEDPRRIYRIYKAIAEAGLITDPYLKGWSDLGPLMEKIPAVEAKDSDILLVHEEQHLDFIKRSQTMTREDLVHETQRGDSIYLSNDSYLSAKLSCGGTINTCRAVVERKVKNALAVVRPPGHHAEPQAAGGFCLFSNVAVAAKVILRDYPESVRKVLILDWDVHHGNGTQKAFFDDDRVLYMSIHRHENGKFYPGTQFGSHTVVGEGRGKGYSVNVPWSKPGKGDGDYIYAFERVILPIAREYSPDLVIISAGFDAADGDIIGGCKVSPNGYAYMTHALKSIASGRLVTVLEGGYCLPAIAASALAVCKVLLGDPPGEPRSVLPSEDAVADIEDVVRVQSKFWKSLGPHIDLSPGRTNVAKLLKDYNTFTRKSHNMSILPINETMRANLGIQDDCEISATPGIHSQSKIVIIMHDAPQVWANRNPNTGGIDAKESTVVDVADRFVEWGCANGYGVVDVCVDSADSNEIALFLWDSYVEYFDAKNIVLIGIGASYSGIVYLCGHREVRRQVDAVICFLESEPLKSIIPTIDEYMTDWFFRSSLIFTSKIHAAWDTSINPKRPRKKFGRVLRTDSVHLEEIVAERFQESLDFIDEALEPEE